MYMRLVSASDVEAALMGQLERWIDSYMSEVERQRDMEVRTLPRPRSWVYSSAVEKFPEDQLPAVILASPGITDPPTADGQGRYSARWRVLVAAEVVARGNRVALGLARLYATALRATAIQQQALEGLDVWRIDWMGERYDVLDSVDDRTVCVAQVELAVTVGDVTTRGAGPLEPEPPPTEQPSPTWPVAETADIDIYLWPLEEPWP